ncbi:MAG: hypothetical protein ACQEWH_03900 [Bacillota bacterium]
MAFLNIVFLIDICNQDKAKKSYSNEHPANQIRLHFLLVLLVIKIVVLFEIQYQKKALWIQLPARFLS